MRSSFAGGAKKIFRAVKFRTPLFKFLYTLLFARHEIFTFLEVELVYGCMVEDVEDENEAHSADDGGAPMQLAEFTGLCLKQGWRWRKSLCQF